MKPILSLLPLMLICSSAWGADLPATVRQVRPSVLAVGTHMVLRGQQDLLRGTGFVVANGNYAVTNSHVVPREVDERRREQVAVYLPGKGGRMTMRKARVVKRDITHDLCLLRFDGAGLRPLRLGRTEDVREGAQVAFTGYPILNVLRLYPATHEGIVSAVARIAFPPDLAAPSDINSLKKLLRPFNAFRLDATAYPGNSGSPLYEVGSGRVVGVINSVQRGIGKESPIAQPSGVSYAIPVHYVQKLLRVAGVKH